MVEPRAVAWKDIISKILLRKNLSCLFFSDIMHKEENLESMEIKQYKTNREKSVEQKLVLRKYQ